MFKTYINLLIIIIQFVVNNGVLHSQQISKTDGYYTKDIELFNVKDSVTLAGTFSAPDSSGVYPLVVMISGSGGQDRHSSIGKLKPFKVISDRLNQHGIATLSFDDRGVGKSTGNIFSRLDDEIRDHELILNSIQKIESESSIAFSKTGVLGHSLGGMIALELSKENNLDFSILLSTPFERGDHMMLKQKELIESLFTDVNIEDVKKGVNNMKEIYNFLNTNRGNDSLKVLLTQRINDMDSISLNSNLINGLVFQLTETVLFDILAYDPMNANYTFKSPTIFVYGSKDLQVPPQKSIENLNTLIQNSKQSNPTIEYILFSGYNHLLQRCKTGGPVEYFFLEKTIEDEVLAVITAWIKVQLN